MADNEITIVGNFTRDPELRFTPSGVPVCNIGVAFNNRIQVDGVWKDGDTSYFNAVAWRALAENIAGSLSKGDRVTIRGRMVQRSYIPEGGSDDDRKVVYEIVCEDVSVSLRFATVGQIVRNPKADRAPEHTDADDPKALATVGAAPAADAAAAEEPF